MSDIKKISIMLANGKKIPQKRVICKKQNILINISEQIEILQDILNADTETRTKHIIYSQILQKISGYKQQDILKSLPGKTPTVDEIMELLYKDNTCIFCHEAVMILYENVREPKQWTLDRIDNDIGHTIDNVTIACLTCNLKRRKQTFDKFMFEKNMKITKHLK